MQKKARFFELIRFAICGLVSAIADYLICQVVILLIGDAINPYVLTALSTFCGFLIGVVINYLISTFWVYRNVDKTINTKSVKFIALFVLFSVISLLLSIATMLLCNLFVENVIKLPSSVDLSIMELIKNEGILFLKEAIFWAYAISFVMKTFVGLVFNYFTRKFILYKEEEQ